MRFRSLSPVYGLGCVLLAASSCATNGRSSYDEMRRDYAATQRQVRDERATTSAALESAPLSRVALIRAVLDRNPSVEAARQGWRAALARYRQAGAYEDPM